MTHGDGVHYDRNEVDGENPVRCAMQMQQRVFSRVFSVSK